MAGMQRSSHPSRCCIRSIACSRSCRIDPHRRSRPSRLLLAAGPGSGSSSPDRSGRGRRRHRRPAERSWPGQLAGDHVQRSPGRTAADLVARGRRGQLDAPFQEDLAFDRSRAHQQRCPDPILIGPQLPGFLQRDRISTNHRRDAARSGQQCAQGPIAGAIRDDDSDGDRLAIFPVTQRDRGAPAEQSFVLSHQESYVERGQHLRDALVTWPFKQGRPSPRARGATHRSDPARAAPTRPFPESAKPGARVADSPGAECESESSLVSRRRGRGRPIDPV
jgi:hypothetical protein